MIQLISVDDIIAENKKNKDKSKLQKVKNIISRFGQFKPLLVNKNQKGEYFLIAGALILQSLREANEMFAICYVFSDLTEDEISAVYLIQNSPKDIDVMDNARRIEAMVDPRQVDRLSNVLPFSRKELRNFAELKNFDWGSFDNNPTHFQTNLFD